MALLLLALAAPAQTAAPGLGRYAARLCVATSEAAPPNCGPAQVELGAGGTARVRVDDIVYRLQPNGNQVDVVLMHNATQIDEFSSAYDWDDGALRFTDANKQVRYEVRLGKRLRAAP